MTRPPLRRVPETGASAKGPPSSISSFPPTRTLTRTTWMWAAKKPRIAWRVAAALRLATADLKAAVSSMRRTVAATTGLLSSAW